jgi:polyisoprenoid-binding protein YceI
MMIRKFALLAALSLAASPVQASTTWKAVPDPHTISWEVTQGENLLTGACARFDADITFDPADLADASVTVLIDTSSCITGDAQKDAYLPQSAWFDVAGFPQATFKASEFQYIGGDDYVAIGTLMLRGVAKDVSLPFTLTINGNEAHVVGETTLQRLAYGIGDTAQLSAPSVVGLDVKVKIDLKATRQ